MIGRLALRSLTAHPVRSGGAGGGLWRRRRRDGDSARRRGDRARPGTRARTGRRRRRGHPPRSSGACTARVVRDAPVGGAARSRTRRGAVADRAALPRSRRTYDSGQGARRHPEPRARARRPRGGRGGQPGATPPATRPGCRTRPPRCCAISIAFTRSRMRRNGRRPGPSGCTSTAARLTRVSISRSWSARPWTTAGAQPGCGCSSIATAASRTSAPARRSPRPRRCAPRTSRSGRATCASTGCATAFTSTCARATAGG